MALRIRHRLGATAGDGTDIAGWLRRREGGTVMTWLDLGVLVGSILGAALMTIGVYAVLDRWLSAMDHDRHDQEP